VEVFFHVIHNVKELIERLVLIDACLEESDVLNHIEFC